MNSVERRKTISFANTMSLKTSNLLKDDMQIKGRKDEYLLNSERKRSQKIIPSWNDFEDFDESNPTPHKIPSFLKHQIEQIHKEDHSSKYISAQSTAEKEEKEKWNTYRNRYKTFKMSNSKTKDKNKPFIDDQSDSASPDFPHYIDNQKHISQSNTIQNLNSVVMPNQKKVIKEVSVTLGAQKDKKYIREKSLPESYRNKISQKDQLSAQKAKRNKIESRLFQPTQASKHKTDAIMHEKRQKLSKRDQEIKKMIAPTRFIMGTVDATPEVYSKTHREISPNIEIKGSIKLENDRESTPKITMTDLKHDRNNSRRKRKERFDKIQYEKSPHNPTNRFLVKHTYTKLEHDEEGPKFTVIK